MQGSTILHVIDTTGPGGAETIFLQLAEALNNSAYNSLALIKGPGWVEDQLVARNIPYLVLAPFGFLSIPYYLQLIKIVRQHKIRLVQCHLLGSALSFSIVSLFTSVPVVATLHGQVDISPKERRLWIKRMLLSFGLSQVVAVSRQLAQYLVERKLFKATKIEVIHNGVDVEKYRTAPADASHRKALNLPECAKLVGCIGNIRPAKDYATLVRAAEKVIKVDSSVHFLIAGHSKEPLLSELKELSKELKVEKNIHFIGFQSNTAGFLSQLDVFALSSKVEGFSIATLEAMAAGVPVVVTCCGGPEEIIRPDLDGEMVAVGDWGQLAEKILVVLKGEGAVSVMRDNASARVRDEFSSDSMVRKYANLIHRFTS